MDYEIVWNAYYAILSKYVATNGLDYHKYLDLKQMAIDKNWEAIYESAHSSLKCNIVPNLVKRLHKAF